MKKEKERVMAEIKEFINRIICGHVLEVLKTMPDESVSCIPTSPPYFGLRDYGDDTKTVWGGDPECEHEWGSYKQWMANSSSNVNGSKQSTNKGTIGVDSKRTVTQTFCQKCGAYYGQLGLEPTLDMYIEHLLQITAELKRVLRKDGVMFWNHGDCYGGSGGAGGDYQKGGLREGQPKYPRRSRWIANGHPVTPAGQKVMSIPITSKCLALQNYRLILRMIDEQGWILRNILIWHKPNSMPSSVRDRLSNTYEPVFMLVKSKKYFFDLDAVRVPQKENKLCSLKYGRLSEDNKFSSLEGNRSIKQGTKWSPKQREYNPSGKNPGDLFSIPTEPFPEAHFATFPKKLIEPLIKAACPQWVCKKCGKPKKRITQKGELIDITGNHKTPLGSTLGSKYKKRKEGSSQFVDGKFIAGWSYENKTIGFTDCQCGEGFEPGIALDPFGGSGTVGVVARKLNRRYIIIDIKQKYCDMAEKRISAECQTRLLT